jgi:hypothetical protein
VPRGLGRGLGDNGVRAGGAELGEFVAVGVGLPLGPLGAGAQVRTQFLAFAGGVGAGLAEHPAGVGAYPLGFGLGGVRGGAAVGFGGLGSLLGGCRAVLGGGQLLAHLLGGGISLGAELIGLGGGGVGQGVDPVAQVGAER